MLQQWKQWTFHDDISSIPIVNFKDCYVLVFDLTSMLSLPRNSWKTTEAGANIFFPLEPAIELIVLEERRSSFAVDKFGDVGKNIKKDNVSLQQIINRMPLLKYRYRDSFPSD